MQPPPTYPTSHPPSPSCIPSPSSPCSALRFGSLSSSRSVGSVHVLEFHLACLDFWCSLTHPHIPWCCRILNEPHLVYCTSTLLSSILHCIRWDAYSVVLALAGIPRPNTHIRPCSVQCDQMAQMLAPAPACALKIDIEPCNLPGNRCHGPKTTGRQQTCRARHTSNALASARQCSRGLEAQRARGRFQTNAIWHFLAILCCALGVEGIGDGSLLSEPAVGRPIRLHIGRPRRRIAQETNGTAEAGNECFSPLVDRRHEDLISLLCPNALTDIAQGRPTTCCRRTACRVGKCMDTYVVTLRQTSRRLALSGARRGRASFRSSSGRNSSRCST
ncbi:hypothetical protein C8Q79DRAFT_659515 [Trametes meyenii]|nr:hypothetical protein C8Q79DRAFT_659515 [Trametes meyenii]